MTTITSKQCTKCGKDKKPIEFYRNNSARDGLTHFCKTCTSSSYTKEDSLTVQEESLLLRYLPHMHKNSNFICKYPQGNNRDQSEPITMYEIAIQNNLKYYEIQSTLYKLTRMGFITMVIKGSNEGRLDTNIVYKKDKIRDYFFS